MPGGGIKAASLADPLIWSKDDQSVQSTGGYVDMEGLQLFTPQYKRWLQCGKAAAGHAIEMGDSND